MRVKACTIIGCNSENFWGCDHSNFLFYILRFCTRDSNISLTHRLKCHYVDLCIDCSIVKFGRILMYLNVTLWTPNMHGTCRKFKIFISSFSFTCSYETISHMNEVKAESPST